MSKFLFVVLASSLWCVAPSSSALSGKPVNGVVLDETSGKPISDAIVYASWRGHGSAGLADGGSVCFHVETARTDAEGKFRLAGWSDGFSLRDMFISEKIVILDAFKPGYNRLGPPNYTGGKIFLAPRGQQTDASYFEYLAAVDRQSMCPGGGRSLQNLYPLFNALVAEAKQFARTKEERDTVKGMAQMREQFLSIQSDPSTFDDSYVKPADR